MKLVRYHWELDVYKLGVEAAMRVFELAEQTAGYLAKPECARPRAQKRASANQSRKNWPRQAGRNLLRPGTGALRSSLSYGPGYSNRNTGRELHKTYDQMIGKLVTMGNHPERWTMSKSRKAASLSAH